MAEGSHGRDYRPSQGAFRAVDRVDSNNPRLQQARRITSSADHSPSLRHRIRNIALALGIASGAGAAGVALLNEASKPPRETYHTYREQLDQIDTRQYLIQIHIDGRADLNIRSDAYRPRPDEADNEIKLDDVATINGIEWDGKSPVVIENTPMTMALDPANRILEAPWLAVRIGKRSLLGDITETVGFFVGNDSTSDHITPIGDEGEVIGAAFNNGQIFGKNVYGEKIIPTENVGLARIATQAEITQATNPQS